MALNLVYGLPRSGNRRSIDLMDVANARLNNQFFLFGTNPEFPSPEFPANKEIIAFLEFVQSTGSFTITDAEANVISGALVSPFGDGHSPLRLDGGFLLTGTILGAKGYFLQK